MVWATIETPEQIEDYEFYRADHAKRFPKESS